jgi:hypothetical protein
MAENVIPFPLPHRGDPDPRRMALASIGFHWQAGMWSRGRVVLFDAEIDAMDARTWAQGFPEELEKFLALVPLSSRLPKRS